MWVSEPFIKPVSTLLPQPQLSLASPLYTIIQCAEELEFLEIKGSLLSLQVLLQNTRPSFLCLTHILSLGVHSYPQVWSKSPVLSAPPAPQGSPPWACLQHSSWHMWHGVCYLIFTLLLEGQDLVSGTFKSPQSFWHIKNNQEFQRLCR